MVRLRAGSRLGGRGDLESLVVFVAARFPLSHRSDYEYVLGQLHKRLDTAGGAHETVRYGASSLEAFVRTSPLSSPNMWSRPDTATELATEWTFTIELEAELPADHSGLQLRTAKLRR
jgi:hypothetical protein